MSCFFCCKILLKEDIHHPNYFEEDDIIGCSNLSTQILDSDNSKLNCVANQQSILQISSYLHIPKNEIEIVKQNGSLKEKLISCQDCLEISGKLGDLCDLLEITQMKINYYLNLLTDQILKKDGYFDHQQINLSKFQETFHQNCLTKLAKIDPNPVLQLTKCIIRPVPDNSQVSFEEPDNYDDDNVTSVDIEDKPIKIQNYWTNHNHKIYCCDFCPMIFNNLGNKSRHIKASHLQKKTSSRHLIKPCEFCGAMMSTGHLGAHKRNVHGIGKLESDGPEIRKYHRCTCGKLVRDKNLKVHKTRCGIENPETILSPKKSVPTSEDQEDKPIIVRNYNFEKFSCDFCPLMFSSLGNKNRHIQASHLQQKTSAGHLIKPCEYCGAMMSTRDLSGHKKNVHGIGGGLESDGPEVRKYQRCSCGQTVRVKNMKLHKMRCRNNVKKSEPILSHKERQPVQCIICEKLISYQNISAHKRKVHGVMSKRKGSSLPEYLTRKKKCRGNKKVKGDDGVEENSLVKCCEFCGKGVLRERMDEHERLWCEVKKRMMDLGEMERGEREENLKCEGCGVIFEFGRDLRCHLKENGECREGFKS